MSDKKRKKRKPIMIAHRKAGWGDCLSQAAILWWYAKQVNADLWIYWVASTYLKDPDKYVNIKYLYRNAFFEYFDIPDAIEGVKIIKRKPNFWITFKVLLILTVSRVKSLNFFLISPFFKIILDKIILKNQRRFFEKIETLTTDMVFSQDASRLSQNTSRLSQDACREYVYKNKVIKNKVMERLLPFYKSLKLKQGLQEKMKSFIKTHFNGKKVIGIHIRNYKECYNFPEEAFTWTNEKILKKIQKQINNVIKKFENPSLFLATDSFEIQDFFIKSLNKVIVYKKIPKPKKFDFEHHHFYGIQTSESSLIDMFLLGHCDLLLLCTKRSTFNLYGRLFSKKTIFMDLLS